MDRGADEGLLDVPTVEAIASRVLASQSPGPPFRPFWSSVRYGSDQVAVLLGVDHGEQSSRWIVCGTATPEGVNWSEMHGDEGPRWDASGETRIVQEGLAGGLDDGGALVSVYVTPEVASIELEGGERRVLDAHEGHETLMVVGAEDRRSVLIARDPYGVEIGRTQLDPGP